MKKLITSCCECDNKEGTERIPIYCRADVHRDGIYCPNPVLLLFGGRSPDLHLAPAQGAGRWDGGLDPAPARLRNRLCPRVLGLSHGSDTPVRLEARGGVGGHCSSLPVLLPRGSPGAGGHVCEAVPCHRAVAGGWWQAEGTCPRPGRTSVALPTWGLCGIPLLVCGCEGMCFS